MKQAKAIVPLLRHVHADEFCERCQVVVKRAYGSMRLAGRNDRSAFDAAVRVLSLRHPGHPSDQYKRVVSDWLYGEW